ncbi:LysR family transcriptional regulator [Rhizobium leguminosarum]|nr:LysR family transcriptional regulator [Rhizobium leguminosarum]
MYCSSHLTLDYVWSFTKIYLRNDGSIYKREEIAIGSAYRAAVRADRAGCELIISASAATIRQLQVLREVLRNGSERQAARALRISQPAVSQNVKQLEAAIGLTLFKRETNRLVPTDAAWELLQSIDLAFAGFDQIGKSIAFLKSSDTRVVSIAAPAAFSLKLIPEAVRRIQELNRSYSIKLRTGSYQEIGDYILHGKADIGISRLPLDERIFEWRPVGSAVNVCLFPKAHRFAKKDVITPEDLLGEALIDIDPQFASHQMNVNAMRYMGIHPDIAVEYDAHGHDAGFVAAGVGVSITNEILAKEYTDFNVDCRRFEPGASYHYVVLWQKDRSLSAGLSIVVEQLTSAFLRAESFSLRSG